MRGYNKLGLTGGAKNVIPTVFLGHVCVHNPRLIPRDIKKIANYRPRRRSRWVRQVIPSSAFAKFDKKVKEKRDGECVNGGAGEKESHDRTGCMRSETISQSLIYSRDCPDT
jgi:hypothetical protein